MDHKSPRKLKELVPDLTDLLWVRWMWNGFVFMVNCGEEKGANPCRLMAGADLKLVGQLICPDPLTEWKELPVVSLWEKG